MKTKILLLAALVGVATMSANAGVRFNLSVGFPVVVVAPAVVVPACPGVGYVWTPGYWLGRVWMPGSWCYHPVHAVRAHYYGGYHR